MPLVLVEPDTFGSTTRFPDAAPILILLESARPLPHPGSCEAASDGERALGAPTAPSASALPASGAIYPAPPTSTQPWGRACSIFILRDRPRKPNPTKRAPKCRGAAPMGLHGFVFHIPLRKRSTAKGPPQVSHLYCFVLAPINRIPTSVSDVKSDTLRFKPFVGQVQAPSPPLPRYKPGRGTPLRGSRAPLHGTFIISVLIDSLCCLYH